MTKDSVVVKSIRHASRAGFSLIELLLVVAIMGILAGVVAVGIGGNPEKARIQATRTSIAAIQTAVRMYEISTSGLPDSLEQLTVSDGETEAPLRKDQLNDSWGTPFQYKKIGKFDFEIRSAGPDKNMNTEDDLTN